MKLSWKFFSIAYVVVLLFAGCGGAILVYTVTANQQKSHRERVAGSENVAVTSFLSLAEYASGEIGERQKNNCIRQIRRLTDECIDEIAILSFDDAGTEYESLEAKEGLDRFVIEGDTLLLESACRVSVGQQDYLVRVRSDFSETVSYCNRIWQTYSMTVCIIALLSGILLYIFTARITKPLQILTDTADSIADGQYGRTVTVKGDSTEIRRLTDSFNTMSRTVDENLRHIRQEAENRESFVANFTHEMKTPMTSIIGYADMLRSCDLTPAEQTQAINVIYGEAKRLEKMSVRLLELFVMEQETAEQVSLALPGIAEELSRTLKIAAEQHGVEYTVQLPAVRVIANRELLLSLLYNLADNAFKASEETRSPVSVTADIVPQGVRITVLDRGRGISSEHINRLTEPFYREDKARSRKQGGAGLGLALCQRIAAIHGTSLQFVSEPGKGTAVSFILQKAGDEDE